jgi:deoxyribodipyrimidine photo-lyase
LEYVNPQRIRLLQDGAAKSGPVVYWMSREQRIQDNWAALFAIELSIKLKQPLIIIFNLIDNFISSNLRNYEFLLKGLKEQQIKAKMLNIPLIMLIGKPEIEIISFLNKVNASNLITDFDPLKIKRIWKKEIAKKINIPFWEVDAHNIVPTLFVSQKQEFGAYTLRPKINKVLNNFLQPYYVIEKQNLVYEIKFDEINIEETLEILNIDKTVKPVSIKSGEDSAFDVLNDFINSKLNKYNEFRNDPNLDFQSGLSPYLHYGQISSQRVALEVLTSNSNENSKQAFLEELIVRKELSDNFCYYNRNYDNFEGFPDWAKSSLNNHRNDKREYIYEFEQFENATTADELWNAAQNQMVKTGKMHGYMRMYWAKKILEWTNSPEEAMEIAIALNDKYSIDGRDPNGYTGIAWSIGGVHDRAWFEKPIFGKIRYMNYNGAKKKFDVDRYIQNCKNL